MDTTSLLNDSGFVDDDDLLAFLSSAHTPQ